MESPIVTEKLLADVIKLVAGGGLVPEIKAWLTKKHPDVSHEEVFSRVSDHFKVVASGSQDELVGFCIEATKTLFRDMKSDSDYPGALKAIQNLEKLLAKMNKKVEDKKESGNRERRKMLTVLKRENHAG